jgi:two-component sensor histidine kinase
MHDRDALLRELFHRTQNTLQIVTSFARLRASTPEAQELALELERRIAVISSVQDGLYEAGDLNRIDLARVAARIARVLFSQLGGYSRGIELGLPEEACLVPIDIAMPAALALYEALANALLHAYPGGRSGRVEVGLRAVGEGAIELSVVDDGVGLAPDRGERPPYNAGISILLCLAEQLGGGLRLERRDPGFAVILAFPGARSRGGDEIHLSMYVPFSG